MPPRPSRRTRGSEAAGGQVGEGAALHSFHFIPPQRGQCAGPGAPFRTRTVMLFRGPVTGLSLSTAHDGGGACRHRQRGGAAHHHLAPLVPRMRLQRVVAAPCGLGSGSHLQAGGRQSIRNASAADPKAGGRQSSRYRSAAEPSRMTGKSTICAGGGRGISRGRDSGFMSAKTAPLCFPPSTIPAKPPTWLRRLGR